MQKSLSHHSYLLMLVLAFIPAFPNYACVPTEKLSPLELVRQSEVIVVATAEGFGSLENLAKSKHFPSWADSREPVKFRVDDVLKGNLRQDHFYVPGTLGKFKGGNMGNPPYTEVRAGGQYGNCFAYDYDMGERFLFFLRDGSPYWAPLAPVNERVTGLDDPWIWWVRGVLAAQEEEKI